MNRPIKTILEKVRYYEWAYGRLAESDSDIGVLGEYLVGRALNCLPKDGRKSQALYDFVTADGLTIEVKTTARWKIYPRGDRIRSWNVQDQRTAFAGKRPLAQIWIFLIGDFPPGGAQKPSFNAFDPVWWTVYAVAGERLRTLNPKSSITLRMLERLNVTASPLSDLRRRVKNLAMTVNPSSSNIQ